MDVPLIDTRLMHWLNYRYQLKGYLHWGFNAWTDDPWEAPGLHRGDGWHVYPKRDGLLDSLRWEQMRDGLQDYECLWLLEDKIRQIAASLSPQVAKMIEPTRRGQEDRVFALCALTQTSAATRKSSTRPDAKRSKRHWPWMPRPVSSFKHSRRSTP